MKKYRKERNGVTFRRVYFFRKKTKMINFYNLTIFSFALIKNCNSTSKIPHLCTIFILVGMPTFIIFRKFLLVAARIYHLWLKHLMAILDIFLVEIRAHRLLCIRLIWSPISFLRFQWLCTRIVFALSVWLKEEVNKTHLKMEFFGLSFFNWLFSIFGNKRDK